MTTTPLIARNRDGVEFPVEARKVVGKLAVHKNIRMKGWAIMHIPTGLRVCSVRTYPEALPLLAALTDGRFNWDFTQESDVTLEQQRAIRSFIHTWQEEHTR